MRGGIKYVREIRVTKVSLTSLVAKIHYKKIDVGPQDFRIWALKFILSFNYVPWATRPNMSHLLHIRVLKYFFCRLHVKLGCRV